MTDANLLKLCQNGRCLWLNWLIPTIVLPAIFIICVGAYLYARHKRGKSDSIWKIAFKDLKFKTPPEILGNGTFGVVVRAEVGLVVCPPCHANLCRQSPLSTDTRTLACVMDPAQMRI